MQVILIGGTTCGKPYGFYPQDNCGTTYFSIEFKGVNNQGFGDYPDGFSPANATGTVGVAGARLRGGRRLRPTRSATAAKAGWRRRLGYLASATCPAPSSSASLSQISRGGGPGPSRDRWRALQVSVAREPHPAAVIGMERATERGDASRRRWPWPAASLRVAPPDMPAVLTNPTARTHAELARVVSRAMNGAPVTLADSALTSDDVLIVDRVVRRDAQGRELNGRETGRPEHFRLVKSGSRCVLVQRTDRPALDAALGDLLASLRSRPSGHRLIRLPACVFRCNDPETSGILEIGNQEIPQPLRGIGRVVRPCEGPHAT